jgi:hypothetical protein
MVSEPHTQFHYPLNSWKWRTIISNIRQILRVIQHKITCHYIRSHCICIFSDMSSPLSDMPALFAMDILQLVLCDKSFYLPSADLLMLFMIFCKPNIIICFK